MIVNGSAWDNLVLGVEEEREVMKGEVEEACRATMVHEFIKDFPDGYCYNRSLSLCLPSCLPYMPVFFFYDVINLL